MSAAGTLIRRLRLERNYSQAGLCHGICAPSYLSKIEQGQAEPSPEVLDRLFAALGEILPYRYVTLSFAAFSFGCIFFFIVRNRAAVRRIYEYEPDPAKG